MQARRSIHTVADRELSDVAATSAATHRPAGVRPSPDRQRIEEARAHGLTRRVSNEVPRDCGCTSWARDKDLKGADRFNVTEFPEMTFIGTEFVKKGEHTGTITGNLTLHGTTKPVTLDVVFNKIGQNSFDRQNSAGLSARGTLKRSDFGMKTLLGPIGDEIDLIIEIEAKQKS
jgi:hypothetical protein